MSFYWSFETGGAELIGRLACWPIVPGSLVVTAIDGLNDKALTDNGDGTLSGDGSGTVDYDYGHVSIIFSTPLPVSSTQIKADYDPVEGGCAEDCGKCKTHYVRLDISPAAISGQSELSIQDAWARLFHKIERDILPIHVEILFLLLSESYVMSIGYRHDIIPGDSEPLDTIGLRPLLDDTSW